MYPQTALVHPPHLFNERVPQFFPSNSTLRIYSINECPPPHHMLIRRRTGTPHAPPQGAMVMGGASCLQFILTLLVVCFCGSFIHTCIDTHKTDSSIYTHHIQPQCPPTTRLPSSHAPSSSSSSCLFPPRPRSSRFIKASRQCSQHRHAHTNKTPTYAAIPQQPTHNQHCTGLVQAGGADSRCLLPRPS